MTSLSAASILLAFLAGVVSFASPCCLPLVPVYVTYLVGTSEPGSAGARAVALRQAVAFVAGLTVVFVTLWASVGLVGYALRDYAGLLRLLGGATLIVMGLHVAGLIRISALYRQARVPTRRLVAAAMPAGRGPNYGSGGDSPVDDHARTAQPSYLRSALFGAAFAAGWTPCVGPILGGIIGLASLSASVGQGAVLLVVYALGLGVPFVLVAAAAGEVQRRMGWFRRHAAAVELLTGAALVAIGFLMITNLLARLSGAVPAFGI